MHYLTVQNIPSSCINYKYHINSITVLQYITIGLLSENEIAYGRQYIHGKIFFQKYTIEYIYLSSEMSLIKYSFKSINIPSSFYPSAVYKL